MDGRTVARGLAKGEKLLRTTEDRKLGRAPIAYVFKGRVIWKKNYSSQSKLELVSGIIRTTAKQEDTAFVFKKLKRPCHSERKNYNFMK